MTTSTTGTGTITLGSASTGFQSFADAGVSNGDVVQYVIEETTNFEIGTGTYTASGTTLTRTVQESSNSDNAISLAGNAVVFISAVASDLNILQNAGSTKVAATSSGATVTGNLAVTGTVDGRDIATDGTKLDTVETNADVTDSANVGSSLTGFATGTDAVSSDLIPVYDVTASAWEKQTIANAALQDRLGLLAPRDQLAQQDQTDLLVQMVLKVKRAKRVRWVQQVAQGLQAAQGLRVRLVKRARKARLAILVEQVQQAPQDRLVKRPEG